MNGHHLVVGAGPVGTATAELLAARGEQVQIVSRRGRGPRLPSVTAVAADAADGDRLTRLAGGAVAIYNCVNPPYDRWPTDWPPIADALLRAAESSGAVLATVSNLYPYGPVDVPMTPDLPLAAAGAKARVRAAMWQQALAAHEAGRARVTEVRGSDYLCVGPNSHLGDQVIPRVLAGRRPRFVVPIDHPHTFTYVPDVAATLVAAAAAPSACGRVWHVPSDEPRTPRQAVADLCDLAGLPQARPVVTPSWVLRAGGLAVPVLRELRETRYQFERRYVLDSSATVAELGVPATPWRTALAAVLAGYRARAAA
jgi:nucleoside-diphosphate-sugar epimerase